MSVCFSHLLAWEIRTFVLDDCKSSTVNQTLSNAFEISWKPFELNLVQSFRQTKLLCFKVHTFITRKWILRFFVCFSFVQLMLLLNTSLDNATILYGMKKRVLEKTFWRYSVNLNKHIWNVKPFVPLLENKSPNFCLNHT